MSDLRQLLDTAVPRNDAGFAPGPHIRRDAERRTRRSLALAAVIAVLALIALPALLRMAPSTAPDTPPASPSPSRSGSIAAQATLDGTQWWIDLRASGVTDDPVAAPTTRPTGSGLVGLGAIVLLDADGTLRLRNGYAGAGPQWAGRWSGSGGRAVGDRGVLRFDVQAPVSTWDTSTDCTPTSCREGALPYWPGPAAFERLSDVVGYEIQAQPATELVPFDTVSMTMVDDRGVIVLRLWLADDGTDPAPSN